MMRYLILLFCTLLISGCTTDPAPQENKELVAKTTIAQNMDEAQRARAEYAALQKKRQREGRL